MTIECFLLNVNQRKLLQTQYNGRKEQPSVLRNSLNYSLAVCHHEQISMHDLAN